ncbi:MAG: hypothetical protein ACRDTJ_00310 [Pseudonocardiaceae bacterium]
MKTIHTTDVDVRGFWIDHHFDGAKLGHDAAGHETCDYMGLHLVADQPEGAPAIAEKVRIEPFTPAVEVKIEPSFGAST